MVEDYEQNIIAPPPQFRDGYPTPAPRTKKIEEPKVYVLGETEETEETKRIPTPRTTREETKNALRKINKVI